MTKARDLANASTALSAVSATELAFVDGVTSAIQTQIDTKLASTTAATTYQAINANVSTTELGYLDGVTSAVQTQLNQKPEVVAGKNAVINGGMDIWQRGTSVAVLGGQVGYVTDRWQVQSAGASVSTTTTRQATSDTTNLPFIQYCARVQRDSGITANGFISFQQSLETVETIPFVGKTVTLSFYARAGANYSNASNGLGFQLRTGTGTDQNVTSFTGVANPISTSVTLTTTWQRFTASVTLATTITQLGLNFYSLTTGTAGAADYFEITGIQLEVGTVATPFRRAAGNIQGELAACQRYFYNLGGDSAYATLPTGYANSTTQFQIPFAFPVEMRTTPSVSISGVWRNFGPGASSTLITSVTSYLGSRKVTGLEVNTTGITNNAVMTMRADNDLTARVSWSAEL